MEDAYLAALEQLLSFHRRLRRDAGHIKESGLSGKQLALLRRLTVDGPATVGTVAAYLFVGESTASELLARLQERGLVVRTRSTTDNRVVTVAATPAGSDLANNTALEGIPLLRERLKERPEHELRQIAQTFRLLNSLVDDVVGAPTQNAVGAPTKNAVGAPTDSSVRVAGGSQPAGAKENCSS